MTPLSSGVCRPDLKRQAIGGLQMKRKWNGMNWIRQEKRLAIYIRDGMACVYCGTTHEEDTLTLDHLKPHSKGGDNRATNLVTCCHKCNCSRGNRSVAAFAAVVAEYLDHGETPEKIAKHIVKCRRRKLNIEEAKEIIKRRKGESDANGN